MKVGLRVDGVADGGELSKHGKRILVAKERPVIAAGDAFRQRLQIGIEPDGEATFKDELAGSLVHEGTAASSNHLGRSFEQTRDHAPFAVAKPRFPEQIEDFRNGVIRCSLDLFVRIHEGQIQALGKTAANGRLAGAHEAHEDDRSIWLDWLKRHATGAIQSAASWGKRRAMPKSSFAAPRRRKSPLPMILLLLLVLLIGGAIYLSMVDTEVAPQRIEQDVTNEALAQ